MLLFSKSHPPLFCLLLVSTLSLYVTLEPSETFCFTIHPSPNTQYKFHYESFGVEHNTQAYISSQSFSPIALGGRANTTEFNGDSEVNVCFTNGNKDLTPVGIDFYGE